MGHTTFAQQETNSGVLGQPAMADNMSIDKKEPLRAPSEDSMELNSPTPEADLGGPQENVQQQKRKGGRKPVCFIYPTLGASTDNI